MPLWLYLLVVAILGLICLIGTFWIATIAQITLAALNLLPLENWGPRTAGSLTLALILNFLPFFLCVDLALRLLERRGLRSVGMRAAGAVKHYSRGLLVGLILFGSTVLCMTALGYVAVENPLRLDATLGAFLMLTGWIVQGAAEEVLTRGFLLQIFGRVTNNIVGIGVSTAFFMAMHASNSGVSLLAMVNLILFSVFAALFTLYERGLWGIFAIHSIWNWAQGNLFGFQVSGHEIEASVIFDLREVGPDTLTGGIYGPEGGLIVTMVFCVAIVWIGMAHWRRAQRLNEI